MLLISCLARISFKLAQEQRRDQLNLFYVLERHATSQSSADRPFLMYQGRSWSYKDVYDMALKHATWLKTRYAIASGEIVAMDFMNSPEYIFLWMGLWSLGARPSFINYNLTGDPLIHSIKSSDTRIVFIDEETRSKFTPAVTDTLASPEARGSKGPIQTVFFTPEIQNQIFQTNGVREPDSSRAGAKLPDMALLIFTSGTTGRPKPAVVSWLKILRTGYFMPPWIGMKTTDRYYTCMPLYHSSATLLAFCTTLTNGNTLVLGHRFSTKTFWPEVRQHNATLIQYVGETCRYLLAAPPQLSPSGENLDRAHSVTKAFGNGLRPDVWERFKTRFGIETIAEFYGATEGTSAFWNLSSNPYTSGAIGRNGVFSSWVLGKELAVVEVDWTTEAPLRTPQGFCKRVPTNSPGELLMAVDATNPGEKFQGYFNNPAATSSKILRDVLKKGDAWFRTGDTVRWDSEGRWWFCDRIGDTFRWKSENVSTAEVSEALGSHRRVLEANVYGVEIPNHDGRAGCAAILFDTPAAGADERLMEELAKHVEKRLPRYAVPVFVRVVREVTATGNNKMQKAQLRSEGVEPGRLGEGERLWWLRGGRYVGFGAREWGDLRGGRVML